MAVTAIGSNIVAVPFNVIKVALTGMTAGLPETVSHQGPSGCTPDSVSLVLTTPPTDGSVCQLVWSSTSTSNNTITFRILSTGSLDGAVGYLNILFYAQASGGLAAP